MTPDDHLKAHRRVEDLKHDGEYRQAGALAAQLDLPCDYGCHFGFRADRAYAVHEFRAGYDAAAETIPEATRHQLIIGIKLPDGRDIDYCRETFYAATAEEAQQSAALLMDAADTPHRGGTLYIKRIERW